MYQEVKRLADYRPSDYAIDKVELDFDLDLNATRVKARMAMRRVAEAEAPLVLDGDGLSLDAIAIDGAALAPDDYAVDETSLTIFEPPAEFVLETEVTIDPQANTALMGLYVSGGRFCTQCESEGFRRITWFLDRPDVLTRYTVRMAADRETCPTLLSNGDLLESGELPDGRHFAVWHDPFPKPAYLFALVAGSFETIEDDFTTMSGKPVKLAIHVDQGDGHRAVFAMDALKRSMAWDEEVFKREYDLSQFHIVAVRDFNYGAMENKSLNVFNASAVLADSATETDADFGSVERVVAHEYFHNWTGNRITLRNWFQLCLKEGLTVYRDQEFTADANSRPVQRIKDVQHLRDVQFVEDAGPLAHPPRPDQFAKIENFYTPTVYRKGGEVVRVLSALLGPDAFHAGMQLYFERCDGTAATVEDFVRCFEEASGKDLSDFFGWYTQAGTPHLTVRSSHDAERRETTLSLSQATQPTAGQPIKKPLPIPLRIGFIDAEGREQALRLRGDNDARSEHRLVLEGDHQDWVFEDAAKPVIPAVVRGFMAPITLDDGLTPAERLVQMAHEPDSFTRWDAGQKLLTDAILGAALEGGEAADLDAIVTAMEAGLDRSQDDPAFAALVLEVPGLSELLHASPAPDPDRLSEARDAARRAVAGRLEARLVDAVRDPAANTDDRDGEARGRRALKGVAMRLLASLGEAHDTLLLEAFTSARTMTVELGALRALSLAGGAAYQEALRLFEAKWSEQGLVMDKWFSVQATAPGTDATAIRTLVAHPLFTMRVPNRVRSVYGAFGGGNLRAFHAADGSGYVLIGDAVRAVDPVNPLVAGKLVRSFESWRRFDQGRQDHALKVLRDLADTPSLSSNQRELVGKMIGA